MKTSLLSHFSGLALKTLALLFAVALVVYIGLIVWLHHSVTSQAISISQAAGFPSDAERAMRGLLTWLLVAATVPSLIRLIIESVNPFRSGGAVMVKLALWIALSLAASLLPYGLQTLRGVDAAGLPRVMRASDPTAVQWFDPDGKATLFWSRESDGILRFWCRPGITPDTGVNSQPVTPAFRREWESQRQQKERQRLDQSRLELDKAAAAVAERERLASAERQRQQEREDQIRREQVGAARVERESEAARLRVEKSRVEAELLKAQAAERAALAETQRVKAEAETKRKSAEQSARKTPVNATVNVPVKSRPQTAAWRTYRILPGKWLQLDIPFDRVEIRTDTYLEIERPGGRWDSIYDGTTTLDNKVRSMRLHCRTAFAHDIQIRYTR